MEIGNFKISGQATKREWAVYIFIAIPKDKAETIKIYIGKVGDNREGCNPVISRVGNHFSYNKIHSQIRNKIINPEEYDYEYFYCHFGKYQDVTEERLKSKEKINELERELNRKVQKIIYGKVKYELLNPYKGNHISKIENKRRNNLINAEEIEMLDKLIKSTLLPTKYKNNKGLSA